MEAKGFIKREITLNDERSKTITLTDKFIKIQRKINEKDGSMLENKMLNNFSAEERKQLVRFLQRVLQNLKNEGAE